MQNKLKVIVTVFALILVAYFLYFVVYPISKQSVQEKFEVEDEEDDEKPEVKPEVKPEPKTKPTDKTNVILELTTTVQSILKEGSSTEEELAKANMSIAADTEKLAEFERSSNKKAFILKYIKDSKPSTKEEFTSTSAMSTQAVRKRYNDEFKKNNKKVNMETFITKLENTSTMLNATIKELREEMTDGDVDETLPSANGESPVIEEFVTGFEKLQSYASF